MRVSTGSEAWPSSFVFCERRYVPLAIIVLSLAAFNLSFRINREVVTEWDESLYAITAAETAAHGNWIATTLNGELDYYNTKPPLNVWLIAVSFKTLGKNLLSLRLASIAAAWLTVLVLMWWARRSFGAPTALAAGLVLSTTFGFIYVHSGRSANTDALFTLLMLLVAITLWVSDDRPWRLVWLGPVLAAVFLLRGMAVLMPMAMIGAVQLLDWRRLRERWLPLAAATVLVSTTVAAWVAARWQVDEWRFIERMFHYDFVARSARPLEGHTGTPLYYLNVLQKDQYDWLLAGAAAIVLFPVSRTALRLAIGTESNRFPQMVAGAWIAVTLLIPTLMRTKLAWYLNPFFPIFAVAIAASLVHGFAHVGERFALRRRLLTAFVLLALTVAESKLIWYSYNMRDLRFSAQGLLLHEKDRLIGRRVFRDRWPNAGRFVVEHVVGAKAVEADDEQDFVKKAARGDYIVLSLARVAYSRLSCIRSNSRYAICEYPD